MVIADSRLNAARPVAPTVVGLPSLRAVAAALVRSLPRGLAPPPASAFLWRAPIHLRRGNRPQSTKTHGTAINLCTSRCSRSRTGSAASPRRPLSTKFRSTRGRLHPRQV